MPINVEINETQAQSNEVKVGQFRTDGEGLYGMVALDIDDDINFLIIAGNTFDDAELPTFNYARGNNSEDIASDFPHIINGKITVEGYRK